MKKGTPRSQAAPEPADEAAERGRGADKPSEIPRKGWRDILKRTKDEMKDDNMSLVAAGVAFYLLLGIIPGLAALISIYGLVANPAQVQEQFQAVSGMLPQAVTELLTDQMARIAGNTEGATLGAIVGILFAIWGGSIAMKNLMNALNIAYEEEEKRGFIKFTAVALLLTFAAIVIGMVAIGLIVALPVVLTALGFRGDTGVIANLLRWPLLAFVAFVALAALYRFAPSRSEPRWTWVNWGSIAAMLLWVVVSGLFSFYVSNFGKYNETYGSLGAVVILLLWLYISAFAVLLGAELNAEMEHQTAQDTTTEPRRPMGRRGAHVADNLGEAYT